MCLLVVMINYTYIYIWLNPLTHPTNTQNENQLRIIVLDEKRRLELICLVALCYKFAAMFANNPQVGTMNACLYTYRVPYI